MAGKHRKRQEPPTAPYKAVTANGKGAGKHNQFDALKEEGSLPTMGKRSIAENARKGNQKRAAVEVDDDELEYQASEEEDEKEEISRV